MKKALAMKCTQEQFDAVKDKLVGCKIDSMNSFKYHPFLINNRFLEQNSITNYDSPNYPCEVHETWNEEIFLNACGIETERIFKGSELQWRDERGKWYDSAIFEFRLKPANLIKKQELETQILELQNQLKNL